MSTVANTAKIASGKWKIMWFPKKASQLMNANILVQLTSGFAVDAVAAAGGDATPLVGINLGGTQAAADTSTALIPIAVPAEPQAYAQLTISAAQAPSATADLGKAFDIDSAGLVAFNATTRKVVTFVKYLSATQGIFKIEAVNPISA